MFGQKSHFFFRLKNRLLPLILTHKTYFVRLEILFFAFKPFLARKSDLVIKMNFRIEILRFHISTRKSSLS